MAATHAITDPPTLASGRTYDVVCVGTALMDHLAFAEVEAVEQLGLAQGAMSLVDIATTERIRDIVGEGRQVSGGTTANTAVGIASLGGHPVFVGSVADDEIGKRYESDLIDQGVHAVLHSFAESSDPEYGTGRCIVIVTPDSERTMATALGVGPFLDAETLASDLISSAQVVYFDGYVLDFPQSDLIVSQIVAQARAAGTAIAFGLADPFVVERHHQVIHNIIDNGIDILFANEQEAIGLTGASDIDQAIGALQRPNMNAIVTRGPAGAIVTTADERFDVAATVVETVVDVTGAGDLFASGVLYSLTHGGNLVEAAGLGALAAAEDISHLGARPEQPLSELLD